MSESTSDEWPYRGASQPDCFPVVGRHCTASDAHPNDSARVAAYCYVLEWTLPAPAVTPSFSNGIAAAPLR